MSPSRVAVAVAGPEAGRGSPTYVFTLGNGAPALAAAGRRGAGSAENRKHEDLGVESLNGVLATHTRDTLTIPQGQIGNNRDIHVVNERWYSDDLQMLVKTANSDPRFGENTYEFTDISRDEPDATLFQIPPGYKVIPMEPPVLPQMPSAPALPSAPTLPSASALPSAPTLPSAPALLPSVPTLPNASETYIFGSA